PACSGVFEGSGASLDATVVLSALRPSILFSPDGSLPVANSAIAAPTDAAMMRPATVASRPTARGARGALGGALRNRGSSERGMPGSPSPSGHSLSAPALQAPFGSLLEGLSKSRRGRGLSPGGALLVTGFP